jgi:hypothetical protein
VIPQPAADAIMPSKAMMSKRMLTFAGTLVLALASGAGPRAAEGCAEPASICADFDRASVVFVGRVERAWPEAPDRQLEDVRPQTVAFDMVESFKGMTGGSATLVLNTAAVNERVFSVGEVVLVYAQKGAQPNLSTVACTRTRRVRPDDPELAVLAGLARADAGGTVEGSLVPLQGSQPAAPGPTAELGHLEISIESIERGDVVTIVSQPSGYFLVPWLQPGRYRLRLDAPAFAPVTRDVVIAAKARCVRLDPLTLRLR